LVTLLTFLSIALAMLVVSAFAQQQNWKQSAEDWQAAATAAQAKERTVAANAALEKQRALDQHLADSATLSKLNSDLAAKEGDISKLSRDVADAQSKLSIEQGQASSFGESLKLVQADLSREREFSTKLARRNSELERGNIDLTDRVKELTTNIEMAKAQVRGLQQQLAAMDSGGAGGTSSGMANATQIPSSVSVEAGVPSVQAPEGGGMSMPIRGEVTSIQGDLASISVGSADGVAHGMSFLIYRRSGSGSRPQYLGSLKITKVEANQSAGQIEQSEGDIRPGDQARDEGSFAMRG
jgi:hypothetical protein